MYPIEGWTKLERSYTFGVPTFYNDFHIGLDIIVPVGTPIYAPSDGKVIYAGFGSQGGNTIHFLDDKGNVIRFLHMSEFFVLKGDVRKGEMLGLSGNTGVSTNPHTHIDVSIGHLNLNDTRNFIDPEKYFNKEVSCLVIQNEEYDFTKLEEAYPFVKFDYVTEEIALKWKYRENNKMNTVSVDWFGFNVAEKAHGYDFCMMIVAKENYLRKGTSGFAQWDNKYGTRFAIIKNSELPRKYYNSEYNGDNQVCGTAIHEISHLLYNATNMSDKTHTLDQDGILSTAYYRLDTFKGFYIRGYTRLFKRKINKVKTRLVSNKKIALYKTKLKYWNKFGYFTKIVL